MAYEQLAALVEQANKEKGELDAANALLDSARGELTEAQNVVGQKQEAVDAAREAAGKERGDVITTLQGLIARCNELLAELQT